MKDDVKICVSSRVDFFDQYYDVPAEMTAEVESFKSKVIDLGERSADAQAFEADFAAMGLSDEFMALLPKCTPKAMQMTQEQKDYSKQVQKEMDKESGYSVFGHIMHDVADSAAVELKEEMIAHDRKAMIEDGVFDEYTKVSNAADDIGYIAGFFKKKKKK